jgi:hypothetical protein
MDYDLQYNNQYDADYWVNYQFALFHSSNELHKIKNDSILKSITPESFAIQLYDYSFDVYFVTYNRLKDSFVTKYKINVDIYGKCKLLNTDSTNQSLIIYPRAINKCLYYINATEKKYYVPFNHIVYKKEDNIEVTILPSSIDSQYITGIEKTWILNKKGDSIVDSNVINNGLSTFKLSDSLIILQNKESNVLSRGNLVCIKLFWYRIKNIKIRSKDYFINVVNCSKNNYTLYTYPISDSFNENKMLTHLKIMRKIAKNCE